MNTRAALVVASALLAASCAGPGQADDVVISAAASLTDVFNEIEMEFEVANPGVDLLVNYGGSSVLREQIIEGAPVDVYASANPQNMTAVVDSGLAVDPVAFATNRLVIAVPAGNPADVRGLDSFSNEELLIGLCAEGVPCGDFARLTLANAGVTPRIDTNEPDVRSLLTKIEAGELDAGITYSTDATSTDGVDAIEIPEADNVEAEYQIVVLADASRPVEAERFVEFVLSGDGRTILSAHGFGPP